MDDFERDVARAVSQLAALDAAVSQALPKGARAGALLLRGEAQRRAPRRTGKLADSAHDEPVEATATMASHRVAFRAFYARFVDKGHPVTAGGAVVGRARAVRFLSGPVAEMRKTAVSDAVTDTIYQEVAQAIARYNR